MKRLICALLALTMCATGLTGCRRNQPDETTAPTLTTPTSVLADKMLDEIVEMIYEKHPMELSLITVDVALDDSYAVQSYLGLDSSDGIAKAVASESGFGSQAYSLVLCRVKDPANAQSIARQMFQGIDRRKWICVEADDLMVSTYGDLVLLVMIDSAYADVATAQQLTDAFADVSAMKADLILKD